VGPVRGITAEQRAEDEEENEDEDED